MQTIHDPHVTSLDLSPLFASPIRVQTLLAPHHPGQANYIWEIHTDEGAYIVRSPRLSSPPDEDFWQGALRLFEIHTLNPGQTARINHWLAAHSHWRVPNTLGQYHWSNRDWLVVEKIPGHPLKDFQELSRDSLVDLGRTVSHLHHYHQPKFGPARSLWDTKAGQPLDQFSARLKATMQHLVLRYYSDDAEAAPYVAQILGHGATWPPIGAACPIMLDWDPTQFVADRHRLTGLVDTELYVVGPPQLELCALEYLFDHASAQAFMDGYRQIGPFPDLTPYRLLFRVFLRLISFQGPVSWRQWMDWSATLAMTPS